MSGKMDVRKLTQDDWEKYGYMRKETQNKLWLWGSVLIIVVLGVAVGLAALHVGGQLHKIASYSINGENYTLHLLQTEGISPLTKNNTTTLSLINALSSNSKALATMTVSRGFELGIFVYVFSIAVVALVIVFLVLWILQVFSAELPCITSLKQIGRLEKRKRKEIGRLKARNFSDEDITWYYDVRRALAEYAYFEKQ